MDIGPSGARCQVRACRLVAGSKHLLLLPKLIVKSGGSTRTARIGTRNTEEISVD
jgi:hypothetical protein